MKFGEGTLQELREKGIYGYDWSSVKRAISCGYSYYLRHELGLQRKDAKLSYGIEFGMSIHAAGEEWYNSRDDDKALDVFKTTFAPNEEPPKISNKTGKELAATYTLIFGCNLLEAYFDKYSSDNRKVLGLELPLGEEICENSMYCGRIDRLQQEGSIIRFSDIKTSKYFNKFRLNPNPQFLGYTFLTELFLGQETHGELDMLGVSKSASPHELLRREPVKYSTHQKNRWKKSMIYHIEQINYWRKQDFWPQNWNCDPYFSECEFAPLCTLAKNEALEPILNSMYTVDFWDPFMVN